MQEAWQQCCTAGYGLEEVNEVCSTFSNGECSRLEELSLPIAAMSKTSTTKYALAILPTEIGGSGYYKNDDDNDNDNDMEDNGEGGNKSVPVPSLAAQQAQLVSNHIRYSDVNSDKHDSFADTEMVDKDSTDPVTKDPSGSQPPISTGNMRPHLAQQCGPKTGNGAGSAGAGSQAAHMQTADYCMGSAARFDH